MFFCIGRKMYMEQYRSKCCKAEVSVEGTVTRYFLCSACDRPCDVVSAHDHTPVQLDGTEGLPRYSIRDISRRTKVVMDNLPCVVTYEKRPIAVISKIDGISSDPPVQDVSASATRRDRGAVSANEEGHLPSFL